MAQGFINNWSAQLTQALGGTANDNLISIDAAALALLDQSLEYHLTITNAARTAYEIVHVLAYPNGQLGAIRGQDGTTPRAWPAGSTIYAAVTAGQLAAMAAQKGIRESGELYGAPVDLAEYMDRRALLVLYAPTSDDPRLTFSQLDGALDVQVVINTSSRVLYVELPEGQQPVILSSAPLSQGATGREFVLELGPDKAGASRVFFVHLQRNQNSPLTVISSELNAIYGQA